MSKRVQNPLLGKNIVLFDLEIPGTPRPRSRKNQTVWPKILLGTFFNNIISMIKQRQ
jgi:hypothetical protein